MFCICAFAMFRLFHAFPNLDNWVLTVQDLNTEGGVRALDSN